MAPAMASLDGPRLAPAAGGPPTALVIFVHGYGASGADLMAIGSEWAAALPHAAFASPDAPEAVPGFPDRRQWFTLTMRDPEELWRGVTRAGPLLGAFIDAEAGRLRLGADRVVLVGFSQGTMLSLHVGLRHSPDVAAVVGYSGRLAGPEHLREATARPALTLIHGTEDELIPPGNMLAAAQALCAAEIAATWHLCPGVGHGIDGRALALGLDAVRRAIG
jgi:phospholipase/carboxylesterase